MALLETLDKWNKVMPVKITERNLLSPNEDFLLDALINIFIKIDQPVPENLKREDEDLQKNSKLKLCHKVDELYKLSDKKNGFFYLDLIEPSPKRTLHLLQTLLNYVLYYDMVKEEMVAKCEGAFKQLEGLKTRKCALQIHIQNKMIEEENRRQLEENLMKEIKQRDAEIAEEKMKLNQIDEKWQRWQEKIKQLEKDSLATKLEICRMEDDLLPKSSIECLEREIESVQSTKQEIEAIIAVGKINNDTIYKDNEQISQQIAILETLVMEARRVEGLTNPKKNGLNASVQEIKELVKKLSTMKADAESMNMKEKAAREKIVAKKEEMKNLIAKYNEYEKSRQRYLENMIRENAVKKEKIVDPMKAELEEMQKQTQLAISYISEMLSLMDISDLI